MVAHEVYRLSLQKDREKVPVVILDRERHFKEITEVESQAMSTLKI